MPLTWYPSTHTNKKKKQTHDMPLLCAAARSLANMWRLGAAALRVNTVCKIEGLLPWDTTLDAMCQSTLERRAPVPADRRVHFEAFARQRRSKPSGLMLVDERGPRKTCVDSARTLFTPAVRTDTGACVGIHSLLYCQTAQQGGIDW